jgi:hypothetical protein
VPGKTKAKVLSSMLFNDDSPLTCSQKDEED